MPRRGSKRNSTKGGNALDKEVSALFALGDKADQNALLKLRRKYGDDALVDEIERVFVQRHHMVVKKAKAFADAVRNKYAHTNIPYHMILQKARLHSKKHGLNAAEFAEFQRIFEQELAGTSRQGEVVVPVTNMMKILGNLADARQDNGAKLNLESGDYKNLQEILKLYSDSKQLHSQVVLQSLLYGDGLLNQNSSTHGPIAPEALNVLFDKTKHNQTDHIHPLLVALFLRANHELDNHFLLSNIAGIVRSRYNKEALTTRADYELFYDMVTDPNDIICDHRSPMADLLHRANLQNSLWHNVISLRNGRCYDASYRNFMESVDVCRLNKYDNPDLVYGRHDGTIAKRLLSAFSYRPTVVTTRPVQTVIMSNNPYSTNVRPTVTRIPMVTFRATTRTHHTGANAAMADTIYLRDELKNPQRQYFIEGNVVVQREVNILYSRGNVIVYVDRRGTRIDLQNYPTMHYNQVPVGVNGFEKINTDIKVVLGEHNNGSTPLVPYCGVQDVTNDTQPQDIRVGNVGQDDYYLAAALCAKTQRINQNLTGSRVDENVVIGSTAYVNLWGVKDRGMTTVAPFAQRNDSNFDNFNGVPVNTTAPGYNLNIDNMAGSRYDYFVQYDPMILSAPGNVTKTSPYVGAQWVVPTGSTPQENTMSVREAVCKRGLLLVLTNQNLTENLRIRETNA